MRASFDTPLKVLAFRDFDNNKNFMSIGNPKCLAEMDCVKA